jgi:hypothetical protein
MMPRSEVFLGIATTPTQEMSSGKPKDPTEL